MVTSAIGMDTIAIVSSCDNGHLFVDGFVIKIQTERKYSQKMIFAGLIDVGR
ncbi:hypothetical protein [Vibrio sp. WXL103]|uniref:hypothetical protein n=1 Tax=Vibrio sp. WXL103 TaxID=3450710 RepID=UPI003EC93A2B